MLLSPDESFPELLRDYRTSMGWTQKELADEWHFSVGTIAAWEEGKRKPSKTQVPGLSQKLKIDPQSLARIINGTQVKEERKQNKEARIQKDQDELITVFPNQKECEEEIKSVALEAKNVKILTIRGEKYFVGPNSILSDLYTSRRTDFSMKILLLSPEAKRTNDEVAARLLHTSGQEIREKMRKTLDYFLFDIRNNTDIEVRCYIQEPNFKILLFDDILFVSAIVTAKNDQNAAMFKMRKAGNPLFMGFERLFDEWWDHAEIHTYNP